MAYTTIDDPAQYFNTVLYTGDIVDGDGTGHDQAITGVGFQPNFVWHKGRSHARQHIIVDSVRGTGGSPTQMLGLSSQDNNAETNSNTNGWIESIDSDGITVTSGNDSSSKSNNAGANGNTYVIWNWKEDATAGFDIVTYTGASGDQTFAHSLGAAPEWYLVKERGNTNSWVVNHIGLANQTNAYLLLNSTDAAGTDSWFNSTAPSSSVVHANDGDSPTNRNGGTYVMYLWRGIKGFSKFGSFVGNADANGPFVFTGFRPAWVLIKNSSANGENWNMFDNKRNGFNGSGEALRANTGEAEYDRNVDFLANGFKIRDSSGEVSGDGNTLIYMAFAEAPFVNSNGVPCNAK
jgi:hypothetical protein